MKKNPLKQLTSLGQSIWLDYIRRDLMVSGELQRLIEDDGVRGMTSNPAIFEKAIVESREYDADIRSMTLAGKDAKAIYEAITRQLEDEGVKKFIEPYDKLLKALEQRRPHQSKREP